jgi:hypothetical protein
LYCPFSFLLSLFYGWGKEWNANNNNVVGNKVADSKDFKRNI